MRVIGKTAQWETLAFTSDDPKEGADNEGRVVNARPLSLAGQQIGFPFLSDRFRFYEKVLILNVKMRSFFCGLRHELGPNSLLLVAARGFKCARRRVALPACVRPSGRRGSRGMEMDISL